MVLDALFDFFEQFSLILPKEVWLVIVAYVIAFILAFGIGANDVANSFGTSVGSKALSLKQACILASVFETLGAVLIGSKVSDTIRKGVIHTKVYKDEYYSLMLGQLSSLIGSCVWLFVATFARLPVSGTHSIVGATIGFCLVDKGFGALNWYKLIEIVASWFISPVMSGLVSVGIFVIVKYLVLLQPDPLEPGLRFLPCIYAVLLATNAFSIIHNGPFGLGNLRVWHVSIVSCGIGVAVLFIMKVVVVPYERKRIMQNVYPQVTASIDISAKKNDIADDSDQLLGPENDRKAISPQHQPRSSMTPVGVKDTPEQGKLFGSVQVLAAIFGAFAHGGNDVSNAIAPLVGIWLCAVNHAVSGGKIMTPFPILLYGGLGISMGLWLWGRRVIKTLGEDLTTITPSSGVTIELGAALTVLLASKIGIPISTTHCKVGSVVFVGRFRSKDNVNWRVFKNILIAWLVTFPASAGISALCMLCFRLLLPSSS